VTRPRTVLGRDPREVALAIGVVRVGIGVVLVVAPGLFSRILGGVEPREDAIVAARIAGARDVGVGVGVIAAVRDGTDDEVRRWAVASAIADGLDAFSSARGRRLRPLPRVASMTSGLAAAIVGCATARALAEGR
jgi:hypothetical protein